MGPVDERRKWAVLLSGLMLGCLMCSAFPALADFTAIQTNGTPMSGSVGFHAQAFYKFPCIQWTTSDDRAAMPQETYNLMSGYDRL
jgi:hypothetical protein